MVLSFTTALTAPAPGSWKRDAGYAPPPRPPRAQPLLCNGAAFHCRATCRSSPPRRDLQVMPGEGTSLPAASATSLAAPPFARKRDRETAAAEPAAAALPAVVKVAMGLRLHLSGNFSTGYRGVAWDPSIRRYRAQCKVSGASVTLGWFDTAVEGAAAYARVVGQAPELPEGLAEEAEGLRLHLSRTNPTGYKGVYEDAHGNFQAQLKVGRKVTHLGYFETAVEAAVAYARAVRAAEASEASAEATEAAAPTAPPPFLPVLPAAQKDAGTVAVCLAAREVPPLPQEPPELALQPPTEVFGDDDDWERVFAGVLSRSDILAMRRDCSASLPPSPPATPAPLGFRSWQLPARVDVLAPIQVSLALVAVCAAVVAELYTSPVFFLAVVGFAAIAVVCTLAQASPRIVARALTTIMVCTLTLRLIQVLVSSPADLINDLAKLIKGRLGLLSIAVACGASFGVLPPSALPSSRKQLAVAYYACMLSCVALVLRVRTGDERMPFFALLHGVLPFVVSVLAAQAVLGSSLG